VKKRLSATNATELSVILVKTPNLTVVLNDMSKQKTSNYATTAWKRCLTQQDSISMGKKKSKAR